MKRYRWRWPTRSPEGEARLAKSCQLSLIAARVLLARGWESPEAVRRFLADPDPAELNPLTLAGMSEAVARVAHAIQKGELMAVYGDYDVDGQASTALLVGVLRLLGARVTYYVPDRLQEGYGLHEPALRQLRERGVSLVITVDCGISARDVAAAAPAIGLDLVITDHHQVPPELPPAHAVVNPHRPDCGYRFKMLAGVGVAYKLAVAIWQAMGCPEEGNPEQFLDLVALGTVADVMPLVGENRYLVRRGLAQLNEVQRPGLKALVAIAGLKGEIGAGHVAFMLAPRLNAGGRLQDPAAGVRLLLTAAETEAEQLAGELDRLNRMRQSLEGFIIEQARRQVESEEDLAHVPALVVAGEGWHPGVIGIVASRLVETYYRPTLVIGIEGEVAKGSGRGIAGLDLFAALSNCQDLFQSFGGHEAAAGFTMDAAHIGELKRRFREEARAELAPLLATGQLLPEVKVDAEVELDELSEAVVNDLDKLGPHGAGNPSPILGHRRLRVEQLRQVGPGGRHLQVLLRQGEGGAGLRAIGFGMGELAAEIPIGSWVQAAFSLQMDEWRGRKELKLRLKTVEPVSPPAVGVSSPSVLTTIAAGGGGAGQEVAAAAEAAVSLGSTAAPSSGAEAAAPFQGLFVEDRRQGKPGYTPEAMRRALMAEELSSQRGPVLLLVLDDEQKDEALRVGVSGLVRVESLARSDSPFHALEFDPVSWFGNASLRDGDVAERGVLKQLQVVVACLPPMPGYLAAFSQAAQAADVRLCWHLLYGTADLTRVRSALRRFYPSRDDLARCYRMWRQLFGKASESLRSAARGGQEPRRARGADQGRADQIAHMAATTRAQAWRIFSEIGLVEGEGHAARFKPLAPGEKFDLETSPTYVEGMAVRNAFQRWGPQALHAASVDVVRLLCEPISPS